MNPPIVAVEAIGDDLVAAPLQAAQAQPATQFGSWFTQELANVNAQMVNAEQSVAKLAAGASGNVHDTMIQLEQARLAFQLAINVRTRVLEAYQEIMRMQV